MVKKKLLLLSLVFVTFLPFISSCNNDEVPLDGYDVTVHMYTLDGRITNRRLGINIETGEALVDKIPCDPRTSEETSTHGGYYLRPFGLYLDKNRTRKMKASEVSQYDGSYKEIWAYYASMNDLDENQKKSFIEGTYTSITTGDTIVVSDEHYEYQYGDYFFEIDGIEYGRDFSFLAKQMKVNNEVVENPDSAFFNKIDGGRITSIPSGALANPISEANILYSYCYFNIFSIYLESIGVAHDYHDFYFNKVNTFIIDYDL